MHEVVAGGCGRGHHHRGDECEILVRLEQVLLLLERFGGDSLGQGLEALVLRLAVEACQSARLGVVLGVERVLHARLVLQVVVHRRCILLH